MEIKRLEMELKVEALSDKYKNIESHKLSPRRIAVEYHEGDNIKVSLDVSGSSPATFLNLNIKPNRVADFFNFLKNSGDDALERISRDIDEKIISGQKQERKSQVSVYIGYDSEGNISSMSRLVLKEK